jgi:hypothetical protein
MHGGSPWFDPSAGSGKGIPELSDEGNAALRMIINVSEKPQLV